MTVLQGSAFIDGRIEEGVAIRIDGSRIAAISRGDGSSGRLPLILPGFVDVHVHGGAGADFMDGSSEAVRAVTRIHARHGTTCLAATTLSGSRGQIRAAVEAIAGVARDPESAASEIAAIHFEGPYLASKRAGAQDRDSLRSPDPAEIEEWIAAAADLRLIMTVAPDREGVVEAIDRFASRILFSIGHTDASYEACLRAVERGARHFTHLFNAMPSFHHREPGPVGAAIRAEETTAELIADGVHVHPVALASIARLLPRRAVLVTDAIRACGEGDGHWRLHEYDVEVRGAEARLADGTLAGSVLTMDAAVRNMVNLPGLELESVVPLATETPARILGIDGRKGRIAAGFDADLVVMNRDLEIERVFVRGTEIDL